MLLRRLVLEDFGLYRGVQEIDLTPRQKRGRTLPVVLFGGKNGAGKSTIFEAILLCLYGRGAIGERARQSEYFEYLFQRIHRSSGGLASSRASVTVEFDFVQAGERHVYEVTRSWVAANATSSSIDTSLDLRRDGQRLGDLDHEHWDDFLKELIPPGLSQLFFFDGEKIQRLAEEQDSGELGRSVKSLLNLDLVERLSSDLQVYLGRQVKAVAGDSERTEIEKLEELRNTLLAERERLCAQRAVVQETKLDRAAIAISKLEQRLRSEGSELAKVRDDLGSERGQLQLEVKRLEERLRELCAGTLVFALCTETAARLRKNLSVADELISAAGKKKVVGSISAVLKQFSSGALDGSESLDARARKKASEVLRRSLEAAIGGVSQRVLGVPLRDLSSADRNRLLSWLDSAEHEAGPEAKRIGDQLESAVRRLHKMEVTLAQSPTEDTLRSTIAELNDTHKTLGAAQQEAETLDANIAKIANELMELDRSMTRLADRARDSEKTQGRIELVKRSQVALKEYLVAVTELKLRQLEREVTRCFSSICRKGDLIHEMRIHAESFEIELLDKTGHVVPKERLSAGEKQVFAVALLWALGRTSGRPLPVIIDTPLARLDSDHRKLLIERYLPSASHQVLVLSTDTEVDEQLFEALSPHVSHAYHLRYDGQENYTTADSGYFWGADVFHENSARQVLQGS
jgi:DNA sulfur modification protein DndD